MIEIPSAASLQSPGESRSPENSSTFIPAGCRSSTFFKRFSWLEGRTKQRRFAKPYSRRVSTTFTPTNPFDPVTKIRSVDEVAHSRSIDVSSSRNDTFLGFTVSGLGQSARPQPSCHWILHSDQKECRVDEVEAYKSSLRVVVN